MENDIYIKVLKFALERGDEGLSYQEFKEEFGNDKEAIWISALKNQSLTHMDKEGVTTGTYTSYYILSFEARFKLIEYQELQEARSSSKIATRIAISALFVSIVSTSFSIYLSKDQVKILSSEEIKSLFDKINNTQKNIYSELKLFRNTNSEIKYQNGLFQQATKYQLNNILIGIDTQKKSMQPSTKATTE